MNFPKARHQLHGSLCSAKVEPHHLVADLCAAPASKTLQLLDMMSTGLPPGQGSEGKAKQAAAGGCDLRESGALCSCCAARKVTRRAVSWWQTTTTGHAAPPRSCVPSSTPSRHRCCGSAEMHGAWAGPVDVCKVWWRMRCGFLSTRGAGGRAI